MDHKVNLPFSVACVALLCLLQSCKNQPTQPAQPVDQSAPLVFRTLPASQIMAEEGITSLHFLYYQWYDSADGGSISDTSLIDEYYVDSLYFKITEYDQGKIIAITAIDAARNVQWSYVPVLQTVSYDSGYNMRPAVDYMIQAFLGSSLKPTASNLRSEYIDEQLCDVYQDPTGYMEWIWREHRFPLQSRGLDDFGIFTLRKQIIEMNAVFSDSLFLPPRH
jgi:hypothetical protein